MWGLCSLKHAVFNPKSPCVSSPKPWARTGHSFNRYAKGYMSTRRDCLFWIKKKQKNKKGICDPTEHLVFILIFVCWEFLGEFDYKYPMLILLNFIFSRRHSGAVPNLLMVPCDQRCKDRVGPASCVGVGGSSGVVWVFSNMLSPEQL